jgi:hypothetical protein
LFQSLGGVPCFANNLNVLFILQKPSDSLSNQYVIIRDKATDSGSGIHCSRGLVEMHHSSWPDNFWKQHAKWREPGGKRAMSGFVRLILRICERNVTMETLIRRGSPPSNSRFIG